LLAVCLISVVGIDPERAWGGDWPMWRHDAQHSAATSDQLPAQLHLQWVRSLPAPRPAWPGNQLKLQFDVSYEPVVMGKTIFVPSMVSDHVSAYDTETGDFKWRFYTDGPVRFAPVAWQNKLYFTSDDGYLYCLNAEQGTLLWKYRGGPSDRRVLGNERLISAWPARGAPVLYEGTVYFAASIWPFMGIFIHALDADTGRVIWTNSGSGSNYITQKHNSPAFAGVSPQGYLLATKDKLLVAGGRTLPAVYDRYTGEQLYYRLKDDTFGKDNGGYELAASDKWFFNRGAMYQLADGKPILRTQPGILFEGTVISLAGKSKIVAHALQPEKEEYVDRKGKKQTRRILRKRWEIPLERNLNRLFIKAGSRLYAGGDNGLIAAVDICGTGGNKGITWQTDINGDPWSMLAADDKLFVVTRQGSIYCFGPDQKSALTYKQNPIPDRPSVSNKWTTQVGNIVKDTKVTQGYCLMLEVDDSMLIEALAAQTDLYIIGLESDAAKVEKLRQRLEKLDLYGRRVSIHTGDILSVQLPPYMASLIVANDVRIEDSAQDSAFLKRLYQTLRPYGGKAYLSFNTPLQSKSFVGLAKQAGLEGAEINALETSVILQRAGRLAGSADWTHQYADSANSVVSKDRLVKAPLDLLWFGGPSNAKILPRHGHGPSPQVVGGRLFIEGPDILRAIDVYTGRLLWEKQIKGLGRFYNRTRHQPGANEIGSNYVSVHDGIYVNTIHSCLRLDPATGETIQTINLPKEDEKQPPKLGFIAVWNNLLIATASPLQIKPQKEKKNQQHTTNAVLQEIPGVKIDSDYASSSRILMVMDRYSGRVIWSRQAKYNFRHNTIAIAAGKIFCIDGISEKKLNYLKRRGFQITDKPTLYALDVLTGEVIWSKTKDVFGTWLGYSTEHDVLVQAGSLGRDRAFDEIGRRMIAYQADDGRILWDNDREYKGPVMLHHDTIITQHDAVDLLSGRQKMRPHAITGTMIPWQYKRNYGCNTVIACENLLTFRSAAAGFYDLQNDGGTGNLGGFKSGCTSNLIPADGVLNAPDYTRTCICSYQNQTSLALVHNPKAEMWTFTALAPDDAPVKQVGINFGAPGDRLADNGTLWLDYPSVGGPSPDIPIEIGSPKPQWLRYHSSQMAEGPLKWVTSSGGKNIRNLKITLAKGQSKPRSYTVRLFFAELEQMQPGQRVFDVTIQNTQVLKDFDIAREAGGLYRGIVKEFTGIEVNQHLIITLISSSGSAHIGPILNGLEIVNN